MINLQKLLLTNGSYDKKNSLKIKIKLQMMYRDEVYRLRNIVRIVDDKNKSQITPYFNI